MVHAILNYDGHVITTMRSKMEYVQEKDSQGKTQIRKVGLQPIQRPGMEYEFTLFIDMDIDHNTVVTKPRIPGMADLIENRPGTAWFEQFRDPLLSGAEPGHSKKELIEFASSYGLEPADIALAFKAAGLEWDPSPEAWGKLTEAVAQYAEAMEVVPDPVLES